MRCVPPIELIVLAAMPLIVGTVFIVLINFIILGPPPLSGTQTLTALVFLNLMPTACANLHRVLVIRGTEPVFMTLTNHQVSMWSIIFDIQLSG